MNATIAVVLFASLILIIGVANIGVKQLTKDVKSDKTQNTISITQKSTITPTVTKTEISPTPEIKLSPTKTSQKTPINENNNLDFKYPNSVILENNTGLVLESNDDPDLITNWYKEKIREMDLSAKSFVQTRANDVVLNKLAGAGNNREITVEISKNGNSKVKIRVNSKLPIDNGKTF